MTPRLPIDPTLNLDYERLVCGSVERRFTTGPAYPLAGEVLVMLSRLGERLCEYSGPPWMDRRCDCKFMVHDGRSGEETGCAELREAVRCIQRLAGTEKALTNQTLRSRLRKIRRATVNFNAAIQELTLEP